MICVSCGPGPGPQSLCRAARACLGPGRLNGGLGPTGPCSASDRRRVWGPRGYGHGRSWGISTRPMGVGLHRYVCMSNEPPRPMNGRCFMRTPSSRNQEHGEGGGAGPVCVCDTPQPPPPHPPSSQQVGTGQPTPELPCTRFSCTHTDVGRLVIQNVLLSLKPGGGAAGPGPCMRHPPAPPQPPPPRVLNNSGAGAMASHASFRGVLCLWSLRPLRLSSWQRQDIAIIAYIPLYPHAPRHPLEVCM